MQTLTDLVGRGLIISPVLLHGELTEGGCDRHGLMCRLHAMLGSDPVESAKGPIQVCRLQYPFEKSDVYWGGDGISLHVPADISAADMFYALNRNYPEQTMFVVRDSGTGDTIGKPEPKLPQPRRQADILPFTRKPK